MRPTLFRLLVVALFASLALSGCGNGSTSPEDGGLAAFAKRMGCRPDLSTTADAVVVTSDGNRIVVGSFSGMLHLAGSPDSLSAGGTSRIYFAAFGRDGSLAWLTSAAGGGAPSIANMTRDASDNLLLVGTYDGSINFGGITLPNSGGTNIFFAKLDKDTQPIWVLGASSSEMDEGEDIAADSDGNVFICGYAGDEMTVAGEDVGVPGHVTGFLVKLRDNGGGSWAETAATLGVSSCQGVAVSADGTVVVCGTYAEGSVEISGEVLPNDGYTDSFIGRFASDGSRLGAIHLGGAGGTTVRAVTTLGNDAIVTGFFNGTVDFDLNTAAGSATASSADAFVACYSEAGELLWLKTFGPGDDQIGLRLARMDGNRILLSGQFSSSITLGSKTLTSTGEQDVFFARLDAEGNVLSVGQIGGSDTEEAASAAVDGSTAVVVGLSWSDETIFPNGTQLSRFGKLDGFLYQQP